MLWKFTITINFIMNMKNYTIFFIIAFLIFYPLQSLRASLPQNNQDSASIEVLKPIELIDLNYEIEQAQKFLSRSEYTIEPDPRILEIDSLFNDYKLFLEKEKREFNAYNPYHLSKYFLESTYRSWEGFLLKLDGWQSEINDRIETSQERIESLEDMKKIWQLTLESEEYINEPIEIKSNISEIVTLVKNKKLELQKERRKLILLEDDITEMSTFCNDIINEVTLLQQHLRDSIFIAVSPPLWDVKIIQSDYLPVVAKLNKARHENAKTLRNYFETKSMASFWTAIVLILIFFVLLRYRYLKLDVDESEPGNKSIFRILIKHPSLTVVTIVLVSFHLLFPYHPLLIGNILTLVLLINMRYILGEFVDKADRIFINKIILLLIINNLEIIFWYFGNFARFFVLFETVLGVVLMSNYINPNYWKNFKSSPIENKAMWMIALFVFSFYLISFFANLFGFLDLAVLLVKSGVNVPQFSIVLFGLYKISVALVRALIRIGSSHKSTVMDNYWDAIEKRAIQIIKILLFYYWFFSLAVSLEIARVVFDAISEFFTKQRTIGTMNIAIGSIFTFILILLFTYLISRFLKFLIEDVTLRNAHLPKGVPAAISVTIRYFIVILGFTFALSAAGIDLGKFGLLAGALGVGIGFGLQNIVNNFISGLILVYERPLQVNDTIEVENLMGKVKRIGIRSSNVRTYDGAEVVVPNGNLISNQLINWTLSDNKRRIEIKVGTSYGSDPNEVLKILEKVAEENEDVMKEPPPRALFENFGDSSLNFRLLFWIPFDIGIGTKSDISVAIFNKFKENNIEIPFPQVDLHVKENPGKTQDKK